MSASRRLLAALVLLTACAAACERPASEDDPPPDADGGGVGVVALPAGPNDVGVTPRGLGPLRIGLPLAAADSALGGTLGEPAGAAPGSTCAYVPWAGAPPGVRVMVEEGVIARIDVDSVGAATDAGVRVGDPEARVREAYAGRVTETPHKYVPGARYLTVVPSAAADSAYRLVFETDGARVTRYRAGRRPPVEYVEGCG
jgi:hypothetical protein